MKKLGRWSIVLIYISIFMLRMADFMAIGWWMLGFGIGFGWRIVDYLVYGAYASQNDEAGQAMKIAYQTKNVVSIFQTAWAWRLHMHQLISRSMIFIVMWPLLSLFVTTSSGSLIGIGLVLGLGLHIALDLEYWHRNPEAFRAIFLWQTRANWTDQEINRAVGIFILVFSGISLLALL